MLDGRRAGFPPWLFVDETHLDREGAALFTADLVDVVQQSLSAREFRGGWIELPERQRKSVEVALEDLEQSRIAVERVSEIARTSGDREHVRR